VLYSSTLAVLKNDLTKLKSGGMTKMAKGGCYAKGGGIEKKGKTKGKII
jgi:hypothetical protein